MVVVVDREEATGNEAGVGEEAGQQEEEEEEEETLRRFFSGARQTCRC